jgi:hypothetical protein
MSRGAPTTALPAWATATLAGAPPPPTVLVLGGFLTSPVLYRPMAVRLRARGAADIVVSNVWLMDWLIASRRGIAAILTRSGRALLEASARSEARSAGAPVLVVGHSAGGIAARLLTSPVPFAGMSLNGHGRIGAIVTLGTPHVVSGAGPIGERLARQAGSFVNRAVPGAYWTPRIGYLAVGSRSVVARPDGTGHERRTWAVYEDLLGSGGDGPIEGDGLIPVASALPPGLPSVLLEDAAHGQWPGRDWYGSDRHLDAWWPRAVQAWEGALLARARAAGDRDLERSA